MRLCSRFAPKAKQKSSQTRTNPFERFKHSENRKSNQPRARTLLSLAWVATINASFAVIVGSPRRKTHGQLTVATKTKTAFSFRNNGLNLVPDGNSSYSNCQRCRLRHKPWSSEYDLRCCIWWYSKGNCRRLLYPSQSICHRCKAQPW